ncbi:hypothetical protein PWT90_10467 [Aphanocladium album]|nr:hypothetical protein PWT90_10467 [Aphanocladium album]
MVYSEASIANGIIRALMKSRSDIAVLCCAATALIPRQSIRQSDQYRRNDAQRGRQNLDEAEQHWLHGQPPRQPKQYANDDCIDNDCNKGLLQQGTGKRRRGVVLNGTVDGQADGGGREEHRQSAEQHMDDDPAVALRRCALRLLSCDFWWHVVFAFKYYTRKKRTGEKKSLQEGKYEDIVIQRQSWCWAARIITDQRGASQPDFG